MPEGGFRVPPKPYDSRRHATNDRVGGHAPCHHGPGANDGATTDGDTMKDDRPGSNPYVILNDDAKVVLWPGACNVHQRFRPEHITAVRAQLPGVRVIVHPECPMEVVDLADEAGSTSAIISRVAAAPPGTQWAIGTEWNLVKRLQQAYPDQTIVSLSDEPSACRTMNKITVRKLARVLEGFRCGKVVNQVTVPDEIARLARVALERMLEVGQ